MRRLEFRQVAQAVAELCATACYRLSDEMVAALQDARRRETHPGAAERLDLILENARLAAAESLPLCQDTGYAVVFVEQGNDCALAAPPDQPEAVLDDAINEGVRLGYRQHRLRMSIAAEPVGERPNTGDNTPTVIHHRRVTGDRLKLTLMAKGGGCENRSIFAMLKPTASLEEVRDHIVASVAHAGADACPPFVVGVGLGGTFEYSCVLAKYALLRPLASHHPEPRYAQLEADVLARVNALGIGPAGLGGDTTALAVLVETYPAHIASLPVAVNIECHSHRHCGVVL